MPPTSHSSTHHGTPYEIPPGEKVNFTEIKNVQYLSKTGNVSAMLEYIENTRAGGFDLIINPNTQFSQPLADRLRKLDGLGNINIVVRVSGRTTPLDLADLPIRGD